MRRTNDFLFMKLYKFKKKEKKLGKKHLLFSIILLINFFQSAQTFAQNSIVALHRNPALIKKEFPYNIRLIDSADKIFNSAEIFKSSTQPLVIVYWLTTCGPCRYELDNFKQKFAKWQTEQPFKLIAVSEDFEANRANYIKRVALEKFPFPTFHDFDREMPNVLEGELNGMPQIFIYNKNREMVFHKRGLLVGDENALLALVKEAAKK